MKGRAYGGGDAEMHGSTAPWQQHKINCRSVCFLSWRMWACSSWWWWWWLQGRKDHFKCYTPGPQKYHPWMWFTRPTAPGKRMLAFPGNWFRVLPNCVPTPSGPRLSFHLPRVWCQETASTLTSRKPACCSLLTWRLIVTPSCWAAEIRSANRCRTSLNSWGNGRDTSPAGRGGETLLWLKAVLTSEVYVRPFEEWNFVMNYPFNWNPQFYCLHG